jgi:hypothetical protein
MLMICRDVLPVLGDDEGVAMLQGFVRECEQFCRDLEDGLV